MTYANLKKRNCKL